MEDEPTRRMPAEPSNGGEDSTRAPAAASLGSSGYRALFSPGDEIAGRYRIIRFIANGGMGEVYEAQDRELSERVALKTVRPDLARDERALERFRREIQLSRRVTHPNVCRIFDLFHHASGAADVTFLTMELLAGETLAEKILRDGPLGTAAALPLARQMAAALDAAHRAGIVHRDFKSANVMLVPDPRDPEGLRAVVTDFGLARLHGGSSAGDSLTGTGVVGTPAYMAPEQVEGGAITGAADIYALGIVLFEMVTGVRPFSGDSPLSTAVKRLREPPPSPRSIVPSLDPAWDAAILRCLARRPEDRFASAGDLAAALEEPGSTRVLALPRRSRRRFLAAAVIAAVVAGATALWWTARSRAPAVASASSARRSIAVLGFRNLSGRPEVAWLSAALSEMLSTELAAGEKLRTIPGENVSRVRLELKMSEAEALGADTLRKVARNLGTDYVVLGSYLDLGPATRQLRLDLRLQEAKSGETLVQFDVTGTEERLLDLVSGAGERLRRALRLGDLSPQETMAAQASLPATSEAARLYSEGLSRLRLFDARDAREQLEKAVAAQPSYPLAHAALASAWAALGYDGRAREEARTAFDLSANLPREEKLLVEARWRESVPEKDKAIEIYRSLWTFFPDNLEYGLRLADVQTSAARGRDALATIERLRALPAPANDDPRIDVSESSAAQSLGDYRKEEEAALRAVAKAGATGARLIRARGELLAAWAAKSLGRTDDARRRYEDAAAIFSEAGDRGGLAKALNGEGILLYYAGDLDGARILYEKALAIRRDIGDEKGVASGNFNIANLLMYRNDLAGAQKLFEGALASFQRIGDRNNSAMALNNLGLLLIHRGNLDGARKSLEQAIPIVLETGDRSTEARIRHLQGVVAFDEGDLDGGRRQIAQANDIFRALGDKGAVADNDTVIAEIDLEAGRFEDAERRASGSIEELLRENSSGAVGARAVLLEALVRQHKSMAAQEQAARLREALPKVTSTPEKTAIGIALARYDAREGRTVAALASLAQVEALARGSGLAEAELDARVAEGEAELLAGRPEDGRRLLRGVIQDARKRGFGRFVRKAGRALSQGGIR
jgi:tetratricopeptide (TPR) repeat protein